MKVSLSAFYAYVRGATYRKTRRQADLDNRVRACFYFHRRRYGTRRIAAELETGLVVTVPSFINPGDAIRVNTETGEYLSRV